MAAFGKRVRGLRKPNGLMLREAAARVGMGFTYLNRVEMARMTYGNYPSKPLIRKAAVGLDADREELPILDGKISEPRCRRMFERPDVFFRIARLSDRKLDRLLATIEDE